MTIYFLLFIWLIVCSIVFLKLPGHARKLAEFLCSVIPATMIAALRSVEVGTDTKQYVYAVLLIKKLGYGQYHSKGMYSNYEPGFVILLRLCSRFANPARILIIVSSIIICVLPFFAIYALTDRPALVYCAYFMTTQYFTSLTAMRQCIAIAIIFIAILVFTRTQNIWVTMLLVVVAAMFHLTAIIVIPLFMVARIRPKTRTTVVVMLIFAALIAIVGSMLPTIIGMIPKYRGYATHGLHFLQPGRLMPAIQILFFGIFLADLLIVGNTREDPHAEAARPRIIPKGPRSIISRHAKPSYYDVEERRQTGLLWNLATYSCACGILVGTSVLFTNVLYRLMYELLPFLTLVIPTLFMTKPKTTPQKIMHALCALALVLFFVAFLLVPQRWFGINPYALYSGAPRI